MEHFFRISCLRQFVLSASVGFRLDVLLSALLMVVIVFDSTTTIVLALESFALPMLSVIQWLFSFVMKNKKEFVVPGILWLTLLVFVLVWPPGHWHPASDHCPPRWMHHAAYKTCCHTMKPHHLYVRAHRKPPSLVQQALLHCLTLLQEQVLHIHRCLDRLWSREPYLSPFDTDEWAQLRARSCTGAPCPLPPGFVRPAPCHDPPNSR
jgi:hypothetical protein